MPSLINEINRILSPIKVFIAMFRKIFGYIILACSAGSIFLIASDITVRLSGEIALTVLWFILFLPIFAKVFSIELALALMPLRKELGILTGMLVLVHSIGFFIMPGSYFPDLSFLFDKSFWVSNNMITFTGAGFIAFILIFFLLITSNVWSMKFLGKRWKLLQRSVYVVIILTALHVILINWGKTGTIDYMELSGLILYFSGKILEWRGFSFVKKDSKMATSVPV